MPKAPSTQEVVKIPLVGSFINRNINPSAFAAYDQKFVNCYPEVVKNPITQKETYYLNKRPGTSRSNDLSIVSVTKGSYGSCNWSGIPALPSVLSFVTSTPGLRFYVPGVTATAVGGEITGVTECITLTEMTVGTTPTLVALCIEETSGDLELYTYQDGGAWTQITDADFLAVTLARNAPVYMDGYIYVMASDGKIWNSDLNSSSAWTSTSFLSAQGHPDLGIGLARYKNTVVGFGRFSTEFFYTADTEDGSPLAPMRNALLRIGALTSVNRRTVIEVGDTVYWLGVESETGKKGVYRLNNYQEEKVSNAAIDKLLNQGQITGIVGTFTTHGISHLMLTGGYCFSIDTGFWWKFELGTAKELATILGTSGFFYFSNRDADEYYAYYSETNTSYTDYTNAYTMTVQTNKIDLDTNKRKFWDSISFFGDIDSGVSLSVSYSDDDYANFSTARTLALGTGLSRLSHLGSSRRRAWKITEASANPVRLEALEITYRLGQR